MQIVIVGDGKVGFLLTQILSEEDHNVTVVDSNPKVLAHTEETYDAMAIQGHGASRAVLLEAGADQADLLIAATNMDEVNLLSCLMAKKLGCQQTIARVRNPEYADQLEFMREDLGLSFLINPDEACAREISRLLQYPSFLERERFANGLVEIVQINVKPGSPLCGISLVQLYSTINVKVLICAVEREGKIMIPDGKFVIQEDDDLFITANQGNLSALIKNLALSTHKVTQVTIVGGSRLGLYLSQMLLQTGIGVKIIERDPKRCIQLAELLPEADIVEADGTDHAVLQAEGAFRSDALVALTAIDEENIILSIHAHQNKVPKIITKCNRTQYATMFRKMGVDTIVSPKVTSALEIVSYVRAMERSSGSKMLTMHHIAGGKAEVLEFIAESDSTIVGIPLAQLKIRKDFLVACITRGSAAIIPSGETVIQPNDSVMIVTASSRILKMEEILED